MRVSELKSALAGPLTRGGRVRVLKVVLPLACMAGLLLSPKLWLSARDYPLSPVGGLLPAAPPPADALLFAALLVLLSLTALAARPQRYAGAAVVLAVFLGLSDQSRWQPWFYQYVFMLAALWLCLRKGPEDAARREDWLNACRLIVASVYFWSGLQKLNVSFVDLIFPSLVNSHLNYFFGAAGAVPRPLILSVPLVELCIGVGLLTRRFRDAAVVLAAGAHALILFLFVPVWRNSVVWPWNVAMPVFAAALFWRAGDFSAREVLLPRRPGLQAALVLLFGVMPVFSFFGAWDSYLSAALYSGNVSVAAVHVSESVKERLPHGVRRHVRPGRAGEGLVISPGRWSLAELNVPAYPERRVFVGVARRVCAYALDPADVRLVIHGRPHWRNGSREKSTYTCLDL
ncbi:MAG TPA: hypothetical protein VEY09_05320 [Pyrinomonadaceae bacterium]|nr:hypothetical protein [Pyrinomonadaceae bacterium]